MNDPVPSTPDHKPLALEAAPQEMPASADGDRLRLGLRHLMIWTAASAVYLAASRQIWGNEDFDPRTLDPVQTFSWAMGSISGGLALLAPVVWWLHRRVRVPFPEHPGEVLWFMSGLEAATYLSGMLLMRLLRPNAVGYQFTQWWMLMAIASDIAGLLVLLLVLRRRAPRVQEWRGYLYLVCTGYGFGLIARCVTDSNLNFFVYGAWGGIILSAVLVAQLLFDRPQWSSRPWTHWMGVTQWILSAGQAMIWLFWIYFARS